MRADLGRDRGADLTIVITIQLTLGITARVIFGLAVVENQRVLIFMLRFSAVFLDSLVSPVCSLSQYAGTSSAAAKLYEIENEIWSLARTLKKGSERDKVSPGFGRMPAGR